MSAKQKSNRLACSVFAVVAAIGVSLPLSAAAQSRRFDLSDLGKLVRVADPQISPDGKSIAIVVARADYDTNTYASQLVLVDVATGAQRGLTQNRKGVAQPRWSPSGDRLAFLAEAGAAPEEKPQLFIMPMNGGDARRITSAPEGVQHFAWRPDGGAIAFAAADESKRKDSIKNHEDAFEAGNNDLFATAAPTPSHIWLVSTDSGEPRRLTSGDWSLPVIPPPGPPASPLSWRPDGELLAFTQQVRPHFGDSDSTAIQVLDVASGRVRPLTHSMAFEGYPSFSPDGSRLTYWYPRDGDPNNVNEIHLVPVSGGEGANLTRALDRSMVQAIWMPDGKAVLVGAHDGTRVSLWLQPLDGPARRLELGEVSPSWFFWVDATVGRTGAIAFTGSEPLHPPELYYMSSPTSPPRRLTDFNHEVAGLDLGEVHRIEWRGSDGLREDGVLIYPPGFAAGRRYPLVLLIHGGPQAASTETFSALGQLIAARGYLVFQPNYRGSDNLGNAYQRAIVNDAGEGPGRDVMAGLSAVVRKGMVDTTRIAVSGWSYGGYMTSWLIGHYSGWRSAVAGAALTDWSDDYSLSDFNITARYAFGGSPWVGNFAKAYREQSPITYAARIRTPTLILSTTGDARVPPTQSYKLFHALRDNGVITQFILYPVPGHFPADPVRTRDVFRRWVDWLDRYLAPQTARGK